MLGNASMIFDVVFMIQHYCLYNERGQDSSLLEDVIVDQNSLLGDDRADLSDRQVGGALD